MKKPSKTAPLRRKIRRLQAQLERGETDRRSLVEQLSTFAEAHRRTALVARGKALFVLSVESLQRPHDGNTEVKIGVERAHWNGGNLVWDGADPQLCCSILVDPRIEKLEREPGAALAFRIDDAAAKLGIALVRKLLVQGR